MCDVDENRFEIGNEGTSLKAFEGAAVQLRDGFLRRVFKGAHGDQRKAGRVKFLEKTFQR